MSFLKKLIRHSARATKQPVQSSPGFDEHPKHISPADYSGSSRGFLWNRPRVLAIDEKWRQLLEPRDNDDCSGHPAAGDTYDTPLCAACGMLNDPSAGHPFPDVDEENGRYNFGQHGLCRADRIRKRRQLERLLIDETVQTELLLRQYMG